MPVGSNPLIPFLLIGVRLTSFPLFYKSSSPVLSVTSPLARTTTAPEVVSSRARTSFGHRARTRLAILTTSGREGGGVVWLEAAFLLAFLVYHVGCLLCHSPAWCLAYLSTSEVVPPSRVLYVLRVLVGIAGKPKVRTGTEFRNSLPQCIRLIDKTRQDKRGKGSGYGRVLGVRGEGQAAGRSQGGVLAWSVALMSCHV